MTNRLLILDGLRQCSDVHINYVSNKPAYTHYEFSCGKYMRCMYRELLLKNYETTTCKLIGVSSHSKCLKQTALRMFL